MILRISNKIPSPCMIYVCSYFHLELYVLSLQMFISVFTANPKARIRTSSKVNIANPKRTNTGPQDAEGAERNPRELKVCRLYTTLAWTHLDTGLQIVGNGVELEVLALRLEELVGTYVTALLDRPLRVHEDHRAGPDARHMATDDQQQRAQRNIHACNRNRTGLR